MKKITYLLIVVFLLSACQKKEEPINIIPDLEVKYQSSVSVFTDITFNDLIEEVNLDVIFADEKIDTNEIGVFERTVNYQFDNKNYQYNYTIEIKDEVTPFIFGGTNLTKLKNSNLDLCKSISYGDNYDSRPNCQIVGEYDSSKTGTYNLKMLVTDSSNNKAEKNIKLKIVDSIKKTTPSNDHLEFTELKKRIQGSNIEYGIDVSSWQTNVDYEAVKSAGISFVMIRIGFQKNEGIKIDSYFKENLANAKKAGLKVGIYYYSYAKSINEVHNHVSWIINNLGGTPLELPIAFDWENWSTFNEYNLSFHQLNMLADTFIKTVNATNKYTACLYSSKYYLETIWKEAKEHPVWLAHYTNETNYEGQYFMWQLSNIGKIEGIKGAVDFNILYK